MQSFGGLQTLHIPVSTLGQTEIHEFSDVEAFQTCRRMLTPALQVTDFEFHNHRHVESIVVMHPIGFEKSRCQSRMVGFNLFIQPLQSCTHDPEPYLCEPLPWVVLGYLHQAAASECDLQYCTKHRSAGLHVVPCLDTPCCTSPSRTS